MAEAMTDNQQEELIIMIKSFSKGKGLKIKFALRELKKCVNDTECRETIIATVYSLRAW
jgi:hypothetical protein